MIKVTQLGRVKPDSQSRSMSYTTSSAPHQILQSLQESCFVTTLSSRSFLCDDIKIYYESTDTNRGVVWRQGGILACPELYFDTVIEIPHFLGWEASPSSPTLRAGPWPRSRAKHIPGPFCVSPPSFRSSEIPSLEASYFLPKTPWLRGRQSWNSELRLWKQK